MNWHCLNSEKSHRDEPQIEMCWKIAIFWRWNISLCVKIQLQGFKMAPSICISLW